MRISTKKALCLNHFTLPDRDTPLRNAKQTSPPDQGCKIDLSCARDWLGGLEQLLVHKT